MPQTLPLRESDTRRTSTWIVPFLLLTSLAPTGFGQIAVLDNTQVTQDDILGMASESSEYFGSGVAVGDFDGDGKNDLAIGVRQQEVAGSPHAGQIVVLSGFGPNGWDRRTILDQNSAGVSDVVEPWDQFGIELAAGDFDGDGLDDLVVAASLEDLEGFGAAGAVHVFYGQETFGLSGSREDMFTVAIATGELATNTSFGEAMAVGDFDGDGLDDLAIGSPEETEQGGYDAGAVTVVYGGPGGLSAAGAQRWTQWHLGAVNGVDDAEAGDRFGDSVAAGDFNGDGRDDLAIGARGEDLGDSNEGAVHVLYGAETGLTVVGTTFHTFDEIPGSRLGTAVAAADFNGDGYAELAVGAPRATCSDGDGCGRIYVAAGSSSGIEPGWLTLTLGNAGAVPGAGDNFGNRLAVGDFDGNDLLDLAVSVPDRLIGAAHHAGAVSVFYGKTTLLQSLNAPDPDAQQTFTRGTNPWQGFTFSQDTPGVRDTAETNDGFGSALAVGRFAGRYDDLVIAADSETVDGQTAAGTVQVLFSGIEIFSDGFESGDVSAWSP